MDSTSNLHPFWLEKVIAPLLMQPKLDRLLTNTEGKKGACLGETPLEHSLEMTL